MKYVAYFLLILALLVFVFKFLIGVVMALGHFLLWAIPISLIGVALFLLLIKSKK